MAPDMPYFDLNDPLCSMQSLMPKDMGNVVQGVSTYGPFEYVYYLDTLFYDMWLACADSPGLGMGLGVGLIVSSVFTKLFFAPTIAYGQVMGIKMKLL